MVIIRESMLTQKWEKYPNLRSWALSVKYTAMLLYNKQINTHVHI